jgi:cytochrome b involved in lipid metabolism
MTKTTKIALSVVVILALAAGIYFSTTDSDDTVYDHPPMNVVEATTTKVSTPVPAQTPTTPAPTKTTYTLAEVSAHSTAGDCWMAIDGKVINPTAFIAKGLHPNDQILNGCGKDATAMFNEVSKHDGGKAQAALKKYQIGTLQ